MNASEQSPGAIRRRWHSHKWIVIDHRNKVRAVFRNCFHDEALRIAEALFGSEPFLALRPEDLSPSQRGDAKAFPILTAQKCAALLGGINPIDPESRKRKLEEVYALPAARFLIEQARARKEENDRTGGQS